MRLTPYTTPGTPRRSRDHEYSREVGGHDLWLHRTSWLFPAILSTPNLACSPHNGMYLQGLVIGYISQLRSFRLTNNILTLMWDLKPRCDSRLVP